MITLMEKLSEKKLVLMMVLLFVPLFLFYLGTPSLWDDDESVYADISRQMVARNDYVSAYFNDALRPEKPPLNYWFNALFYKIFGMNEFATRFGSNIFGFLGLILIYLFGKRLFNKRTGILAALITGTCFLYFVETQMAIIDTTLAFFITLTLYWFYRGYVEEQPRFLLLMGFPLGLAILAKGPVALVLTGGVGLIFWLYQTFKLKKNWRSLFSWQLFFGILIMLAVCLPWYLAMWSRYGMEFIRYHFGYHMFQRFLTPFESHGGAWYFSFYYVVVLLFVFLPWSANIPNALITAFRRWSEPKYFFLLTWFLVVFVFFTISQTKLPGYLMPLLPALTILVAFWWDQTLTESNNHSQLWWGAIFQILFALLFIILIASQSSRLPSGFAGTMWVLFLLPLSLLIGSVITIILFLRTKSPEPFFKVTFITFYLFWGLFLLLITPIVENYKPVKYLSVTLRKYLKTNDQVVSFIPGTKGAPFYSRRQVIFVNDNSRLGQIFRDQKRVFAFVEKKSLDYLKDHHYQFYLLANHGPGYLVSNQPVE
jgi:4-amino-4-deoxy-L-arabinose transferase-like glycosyltransferase